MSWLLSKVTNNPMVLAYVAAVCFAAGLVAGAVPAWKYQGALKDAVQAKYDSFVGQTKAEGIAAQKLAAAKEAQDKLNKERYDEQVKNDLADAAAVSQRLLDARARRGYVSKASPGSRRPDVVCHDRAKFNAAMGYIDAEGARLTKSGSSAELKLLTACEWAKSRVK